MLRISGATLLTGFLFLMTDVSNCLLREFVLYTEKTTWNDAYLKCEQDGGQLLELYSIEEDFALEELMKDEPTDDIWIGLSTDDENTQTETDFKFANCQPLSWSNWDGGFKKDNGKPCVRIKKDTRDWYREVCSQESNFICDIPKGDCTYETQSRTCPTTVDDKEIFKNIIPTNEECKHLCETKIRNGKKCYAYHFSNWCVLHHSSDPYFCETSYGNVVMNLRRCYSFRVSSNAVSANHVSDLPEARTCTIYDPNYTTSATITSTTKTTATTSVSTTSTTTTTKSTTSSSTTTPQPDTSQIAQPTTSSINTTIQPSTSNTTDQITISNTTTQSTTSATLPTSSFTTTQFSSSITQSTNLTAATTVGQLVTSTNQFWTTSPTTLPSTMSTSSEATTNESTAVLESKSMTTVGSSTTSQSQTTENSTAETTDDTSISTSQTMTTATSNSSEATADEFTTVLESKSMTTVGSSTTSQSQTTEYSTTETTDDTSISTSQTMTTATSNSSEANTNDSTTPLESQSTTTAGGLTTTKSTVYGVIRTTTEAGQSEVCICDLCGKSNMTAIEEKMKQVRNDLKVNSAELSSTRRKKESATDERPSAQNIGYIGIILFVVLFGSIILSDTRKIYSDIKTLR